MKRLNKYLIFIMTSALFFGCTENKEFDLVLPLKMEPVFNISEEDGTWQEDYLITYDDVDELDDLDEDIDFQSVSVEGVTLIIEDQDPNLSGVQNVDLVLIDPLNEVFSIYENETISITPGAGKTEVVITGLAREGVEKLKSLLEGFANNEFFENFRVVSTGSSTPQGTPLQMKLTVVLHLSFNYSQEVEVPYFMGNE